MMVALPLCKRILCGASQTAPGTAVFSQSTEWILVAADAAAGESAEVPVIRRARSSPAGRAIRLFLVAISAPARRSGESIENPGPDSRTSG
jgi:hypothetical protein